MKIFICLILFFNVCKAQSSLSGNIINNETKEPVPYVSIALLKQNKGTNSDQNGKFSISNSVIEDTILFSSVGYNSLKMSVKSLEPGIIIELAPLISELDKIILDRSYNKTIRLNDFYTCGINYLTTKVSAQVAQLFRCPISNSILSSVTICKSGADAIFRLRIYDVDSTTNLPGKDLSDSLIEINSGKRHTVVNLEPYKIHINSDRFFIAIEWLMIPFNENHEKRDFSAENISYNPLVALRKNKNMDLEETTYLKDFHQKWYKMRLGSLLISPVLKYRD
ncbi:MAG: carboxypeptidase-like regulatory domain-containing protein [Ferruginibacter sp.]